MNELTNRSDMQKVTKPKIICNKLRGRKKYYCIKYFDVFSGEYHIGYGSYCKKFVKEWLHNSFVTVPIIDIEMRCTTKQEATQ